MYTYREREKERDRERSCHCRCVPSGPINSKARISKWWPRKSQNHVLPLTSKCPFRGSELQGLGPFFQIYFLKTELMCLMCTPFGAHVAWKLSEEIAHAGVAHVERNMQGGVEPCLWVADKIRPIPLLRVRVSEGLTQAYS